MLLTLEEATALSVKGLGISIAVLVLAGKRTATGV
jgi:hypothetical protein